jgi:hypothetical protein
VIFRSGQATKVSSCRDRSLKNARLSLSNFTNVKFFFGEAVDAIEDLLIY